MKTLINSKLKIARDALHLSQSEVYRQSGYHQSGLSALEGGSRSIIPVKYLQWMASKGINLVALFDDNVTEEKFKEVVLLKPGTAISKPTEPCRECIAKDQAISDKMEVIVAKNELIESLKGKIADLKNTPEQPAIHEAMGYGMRPERKRQGFTKNG